MSHSFPYEIEVNRHLPVGPYTDVYGHMAVTLIGPSPADDDDSGSLVVCLDCGYVTDDIRQLAHEDCEPERNGITQSWRERIEADGFPDPPE